MNEKQEKIAEFLRKNADALAEYAEDALSDYEELHHLACGPELTGDEDMSPVEVDEYITECEAAKETVCDERLWRIFRFVELMGRAK